MRKLIHFLLFLILTSSLISWKIIQDDRFIFQKGNQKLEIKLSNGTRYLKWNEQINLRLTTVNIDPRKLTLSAPGLRLVKGATEIDTESIWEIKPERKYIKNDTLKLFVSGRDSNDSIWNHKFKIPIIK